MGKQLLLKTIPGSTSDSRQSNPRLVGYKYISIEMRGSADIIVSVM